MRVWHGAAGGFSSCSWRDRTAAAADVNAQGGSFGTALQAASARGDDGIVQRLLEAGADVNAQGGREDDKALEADSDYGADGVGQRPLGAGGDDDTAGGDGGGARRDA